MVLSAPNGRMTERWFENIGSSFYMEQNFRRGGWFFNWGAPVIPPYGRYDGRDARFGFDGVKVICEAALIYGPVKDSLLDGHGGSVYYCSPWKLRYSACSWRPFVTGWTPVVGNQPQWHSPLKQFIDSGGVAVAHSVITWQYSGAKG